MNPSNPLRRLASHFADFWRLAAARREFQQLDADTVRDLGLSASEFESYWAEAHGDAERTRLRIERRNWQP